MNPEALGYIVGSMIGIGLFIGLLVVLFKVMKSLARAIKPLAVVLGLVLAAGLVSIPVTQHKLSPQQQDQIAKFFESLLDQAKGAFTSSAQADDASPSSEPSTEQPDEVVVSIDPFVSSEVRNPRIDLSASVKQ